MERVSGGGDADYVTRSKVDVMVEDVIAEVVLSNGQVSVVVPASKRSHNQRIWDSLVHLASAGRK